MPDTFRVGDISGFLIKPLSIVKDSRGWLTELFRIDEWAAEFHPSMAYISSTEPGVTRGPHEHTDQADLFCFIGPSNFRLRLWDNRVGSETFNYMMTLQVGADNPKTVLVPKGVVHAYRNIGSTAGL